ncbi:MAG: STAS/SEC14 domain-containing protein [Mycobacterium sp.]
MIEVMPDSVDNRVGFRASGKLSRADYSDVLVPRTAVLLDRFKRLRVLVLMDETFHGWSFGAAGANTVFDVKHRRDLEKVAMVGAPRWEEWCVKRAASVLISGELRTYRRDQLDQAWEWLGT